MPLHCSPPSQVYAGQLYQSAVAIKVLLLSGGGSALPLDSVAAAQQALSLPRELLGKLDEEASLLASLRHNNVVR